MPFIHCTFTLVLPEDVNSLMGELLTVVPAKRPHAIYPLAFTLGLTVLMHSLKGQEPYCQQYGHMPYIHCTFTLVLTKGSARTRRTGPIVSAIRPRAALHIPTSLDGRFCTHSRDRTRCANNRATCRICIAHSRTSVNLTRLFRREAIGRLFTLILPCPPRSTLLAPVRVNGLISLKPFLC